MTTNTILLTRKRISASSWKIYCAEFIRWARNEAERIRCGKTQPYHAVLCDPPYGLEFMGQEWDAPHKATSFPKAGNLGGFADGNKPSFVRQGEIGPRYQLWITEWAKALRSLLHPGALIFCFGGTRTWHRLACGFEDAGFEMWDTLMWLHGQGFPKAQAIDKLIDKTLGEAHARRPVGISSGPNASRYVGGRYREQRNTVFGTVQDQPVLTGPASRLSLSWAGHKTAALKPAWEPVLCFKAQARGKTYAALALEHGSGALNVDAGRIPHTTVGSGNLAQNSHLRGSIKRGDASESLYNPGLANSVMSPRGRYPANIVLDEEARAMLDGQMGPQKSGGTPKRRFSDKTRNAYGKFTGEENPYGIGPSSGSVSRFFYCAKASRREREAGLESIGSGFSVNMATNQYARLCKDCGRRFAHTIEQSPRCDSPNWEYAPPLKAGHKGKGIANHHPTVKPIALTRWLASLLLPPSSVTPRRLLIPFAGVASEGIGALQAGWDEIVMIEKSPEYVRIGRRRMCYWVSHASGRKYEVDEGKPASDVCR